MNEERDVRKDVVAQAAEWLGRIDRGGTEEECVAFTRWLSTDAEHVRQVLELQALRVESHEAMSGDRRRAGPDLRSATVTSFLAAKARKLIRRRNGDTEPKC